MPGDFGPVSERPAGLTQVGVAKRQSCDELKIANPDFVDGVALLVEVVGLDAVDCGEIVTHGSEVEVEGITVEWIWG